MTDIRFNDPSFIQKRSATASSHASPTPALQSPSGSSGSLAAPDRLTSSSFSGGSVPSLSLFNGNPQLEGKANELMDLLKQADAKTLARYNVGIFKNAQGQITGFYIGNKPASPQQVQVHLSQYGEQLYQELVDAKKKVDSEYVSFANLLNSLYHQLTQTEQTSARIQLSAVNVLYSGFISRVQQIATLARTDNKNNALV